MGFERPEGELAMHRGGEEVREADEEVALMGGEGAEPFR